MNILPDPRENTDIEKTLAYFTRSRLVKIFLFFMIPLAVIGLPEMYSRVIDGVWMIVLFISVIVGAVKLWRKHIASAGVISSGALRQADVIIHPSSNLSPYSHANPSDQDKPT